MSHPAPETKPSTKNNMTKLLGARLRVEREAQGISLVDLARAVGVAVNTLRWHEAGSRLLRADELAAAARWLHVDPPVLMVPHDGARADDSIIRAALGARMQAERTLAGKLQREVIVDTGVTLNDLQAHEAGRRSLSCEKIIAIASKLGIEPSRLMVIDTATE